MDEILEMVSSALHRVYADDIDLIQRKASERSIVFRFGVYFREFLEETNYGWLNLDTEYNRNLLGRKNTEHFPYGTYPDLILHRRGNNNHNILIVEFKPWWNKSRKKIEKDILKLKDFTDPHGNYRYPLGLFILLEKEVPSRIVVENGEIKGEL